MVIVLVPLEPGATVKLVGEAERLKSGATVAVTVRPTVVVCVKVPEVPVTVTVDVPVVAVLLAVSVMTLPANDGVTPVGRPDADRATAPVKPPVGVVVIVLMPLAPCAIVRL